MTRSWLQRIYLAQVYVRARKVCEVCEAYLLVEDFDGFGAQPCEGCRIDQRRAAGLWHYTGTKRSLAL